MSLITIEQLLESVDLDFEPRFVTKDESVLITIWADKPSKNFDNNMWVEQTEFVVLPRIKLAEFENKDWQECIYEVPRKTDEYEQNLEKLRPADSDLVYRVKLPQKTTGKIEKLEVEYKGSFKIKDWEDIALTVENKINELVDAVNELKERTKPTTLNPDFNRRRFTRNDA